RRCRHGELRCDCRHSANDELLGQALCPACYDYEGAVLFNLSVSELWRRTSIYILRALGELAGLSVRQVGRTVRLSYVKVVEFQRRGSVHVHAVVRLDGAEDRALAPPAVFDAALLVQAVGVAVRKVHAPVAGEKGQEARRVRWGPELDVAVINTDGNGRARAAAYLAKYSTKSSDGKGMLDHRLRAGIPESLGLAVHLRRLVETALGLGDRSAYSDLHVRDWAHTLGFRGHFATKSWRYSTTLAVLRAARQTWRAAQEQVHGVSSVEAVAVAESSLVETGEWAIEGRGYLSRGESWLVESLGHRAQQARRSLYEDRAGSWRPAA
ncbi:MAG TPA: replication initiator, partial [Acidimicrobiales bacterium]|nr:replication initiator [Acidimicrobiales bacterium]